MRVARKCRLAGFSSKGLGAEGIGQSVPEATRLRIGRDRDGFGLGACALRLGNVKLRNWFALELFSGSFEEMRVCLRSRVRLVNQCEEEMQWHNTERRTSRALSTCILRASLMDKKVPPSDRHCTNPMLTKSLD